MNRMLYKERSAHVICTCTNCRHVSSSQTLKIRPALLQQSKSNLFIVPRDSNKKLIERRVDIFQYNNQ